MRFPNAHVGIKKVFLANILSLIAAGCLLVTPLLAVTLITGNIGGTLGLSVFPLAGTVISIIGLIFYLGGLNRAGEDEPNFKRALFIVIASLVLSIVQGVCGIFVAVPSWASTMFTIIGILLTVVTLYYVFTGIRNLAVALGNAEVDAKGKTLYTFILVIYAVQLVCAIVTVFAGGSAVIAGMTGTLSILASVAAIVGYIIYLVYLNTAKHMLEEGGVIPTDEEPVQEAQAVEEASEEDAEDSEEPADVEDFEYTEEQTEEPKEKSEAEPEEKPEISAEPAQA